MPGTGGHSALAPAIHSAVIVAPVQARARACARSLILLGPLTNPADCRSILSQFHDWLSISMLRTHTHLHGLDGHYQ